jgi:hypothetical protein
VGGKCACPATEPTVCPSPFGEICVDLTKGFAGAFCGSCDALDCLSGTQKCCHGACTDIVGDVHNCGDCDATCATTPGTTPGCCAGACVDLANNPAYCGGCGTPCRPGQRCRKGTCVGVPTPYCPTKNCGPGCLCKVGACIQGKCRVRKR